MNIVIIFPLLFLLFLVFKGTVKNYCSVTCEDYFSKQQTNWLRGIAIVMIVLSHYYQGLGLGYSSILGQLNNLGYLGVGIFFFLSGYATMYSKVNKPTYMNHYIINRISRIYIPFIIVFILDCIILLVFDYGFSYDCLLRIPILSLPTALNWYLKVQFALYIVFYISAKVIKKNSLIIVSISILCLIYMIAGFIFNIGNFWYESCYMFPLGMAFVFYKDRLYLLFTKKPFLSIVLSFALLLISYAPCFLLGGVVSEFLFIFGFIQFIIVVSANTSGNSRLANLFGTCSLEVYLIHTIYGLASSKLLGNDKNIWTFMLFLSVVLILSYALHEFCVLINSKINKIILYREKRK